MIATEPPPSHDPRKAAFDHPPSGEQAKAFREEFLPNDLLSLRHGQAALRHSERAHRPHGPAQMDFQPQDKSASVMTISPHQLHSGTLLQERLKHLLGPLLIGAMGPCHFDLQQVALSVNESVPLAPPDFFSPYRSPFRNHERHWFLWIGCR